MPQLEVDAGLPPHPGVAGVPPRVVQPSVVAELVGAGKGVEDPLPLAGVGVEPADVALGVAHGHGGAAGHVGGPDDDGVAGHQRRGVQADGAAQRVDLLVHVPHQVDDAVLAEARDALPRRRVQRDHSVAGGDVDDLPVAAVVPVREPAPRPAARRHLRPPALVEAVHPQVLAGGCVGRDHRAAGAGGGVDDPADHQRRRLEVVLGLGAEVVGLQPPHQLELLEVAAIDLIERRVARVRLVAAVVAPLSALGAGLPPGRRRGQQGRGDETRDAPAPGAVPIPLRSRETTVAWDHVCKTPRARRRSARAQPTIDNATWFRRAAAVTRRHRRSARTGGGRRRPALSRPLSGCTATAGARAASPRGSVTRSSR